MSVALVLPISAGWRLNCMQPLHLVPGIGHSTTRQLPDFKGTPGRNALARGRGALSADAVGHSMAVELRSEHGGVFLRKLAPGVTRRATRLNICACRFPWSPTRRRMLRFRRIRMQS